MLSYSNASAYKTERADDCKKILDLLMLTNPIWGLGTLSWHCSQYALPIKPQEPRQSVGLVALGQRGLVTWQSHQIASLHHTAHNRCCRRPGAALGWQFGPQCLHRHPVPDQRKRRSGWTRVGNETQPLQRHTVKIRRHTLSQDTHLALKRHQAKVS